MNGIGAQDLTYQDYQSQCLTLEHDLCMGERSHVGEIMNLDGVLHEYNFDNMFVIDQVTSQQALYYSISSPSGSQRFNHGPPAPIGAKFSGSLTSDAHITFPQIVEKNTMTLDFWIFLLDEVPTDDWQMLFYTTETNSSHPNQNDIEIKLWPSINRLKFNIRTDRGIETIDTISSLLSRRWYNVVITTINDQNKFNIYIEGMLDPSSTVLQGTRQTTNMMFSHTFGGSSSVIGTNVYLGHYRISQQAYTTIQIKPGYRFLQSTRDPFIRHGCSSGTYSEAETIGNSMSSLYYICSLDDLYLGEGFNTARIMGWFSTIEKDNDSGTIWIRNIDNNDRAEEHEYSKIGLGCLRSL